MQYLEKTAFFGKLLDLLGHFDKNDKSFFKSEQNLVLLFDKSSIFYIYRRSDVCLSVGMSVGMWRANPVKSKPLH